MRIQTITSGNITVELYEDINPENPRMDDNLTKFVMFHKTYRLPNETGIPNYSEFFNSWEEMQADLQSKFKHVTSVYMLNHSGIDFSLNDFKDRWDSGQVGFIVSNDGTSEDFQRNAKTDLLNYSYYAKGECYGFAVTDSESEDTESVWGFYGSNHHASGLIECLYSVLRHGFSQMPKTMQEIVKQLN